jgi:hypothetical protein
MKSLIKYLASGLLLVVSLCACETNPVTSEANTAAKPDIQFVDLQGFDTDLSHALVTQLPRVEVNFYDRVSPSAMPGRLQTWLSSVEAGGGKVKVTPPKSDISAKDPFLLLSLASSLWSASKAAKEAASKSQFVPAHAYDAELVLKDDGNGHSVIDHVVFAKRAP